MGPAEQQMFMSFRAYDEGMKQARPNGYQRPPVHHSTLT